MATACRSKSIKGNKKTVIKKKIGKVKVRKKIKAKPVRYKIYINKFAGALQILWGKIGKK